MATLNLAIIQLETGTDRSENLKKVTDLISRAASSYDPHIIALPELINFRGDPNEEKNNTEKLEAGNEFFDEISALAKKFQVSIMGGSLLEENPNDTSKPLNTAFYMNKEGELLSKYSKIHLFDVDIGKVIKESGSRAFGDTKQKDIFSERFKGQNKDINMAMAICYDLRFPELFRSFLYDDGKIRSNMPEIVFLPSAFAKTTGKAHWEALLRARAIENSVFIVAPNQYGISSSSFECYGHSMVIGPWGEVIAQASEDKEEILFAEIRPNEVDEARHRLPLQNARLI